MTRWILAGLAVVLVAVGIGPTPSAAERKVGVLYVVHGGSGDTSIESLWDGAMQIFSYDPHSAIYQRVIWNEDAWPTVASFGDGASYSNVASQLDKYEFQDARIGFDPNADRTDFQREAMTTALKAREKDLGVQFIVDQAQWIGPREQTRFLPEPRRLYEPQVEGGARLEYCGSAADRGPWENCDSQRYNIDGPADRLLAQGVDEIVMIDMTTAGVRFWKTYDVVRSTRDVVDRFNAANGTDIPVTWVNDPTDLLRESFPIEPENWTRSLGPPIKDSVIPLEGRPNPVSEDPAFAALYMDGIEKRMNPNVADKDTAVMFINHSIRDWNEVYDPKVNDTVVLNDILKAEILKQHPDIDPGNIIGTWMGLRVENPNIKLGGRVQSNLERSREMRAENLGHRWLYQTDKVPPGGDQTYFYWDGLEYLKDRGVKHIVVVFTQVVIDSVLTLVEVPNQIGKEIGTKTWLYADGGDWERYPNHGHPFADYWGRQAETMCRPVGAPDDAPRTEPCCFVMGGCGTNQPYPPLRQTPIDQAMGDTDPHLVHDLSAYGHLGYDQSKGPPSETGPVQNQYAGTWAIWDPINTHPEFGEFLAGHVVRHMEAREGKVQKAER
jgi:hypothetical protein